MSLCADQFKVSTIFTIKLQELDHIFVIDIHIALLFMRYMINLLPQICFLLVKKHRFHPNELGLPTNPHPSPFPKHVACTNWLRTNYKLR